MINAGDFKHRIRIYQVTRQKDAQGFITTTETEVLQPYAAIKSFKGATLYLNNSNFENAPKNFTIRFSQTVIDAYYNASDSNRDMRIDYNNRSFKVEYLNNVDEANTLLEMQAKEVLK